jgi:predicted Zn-dependent protease
MNKCILSALLFLIVGTFPCFSQDPVFNTVKTELERNFSVLNKEPVPVYYIYVRLDEIQSLTALGRLGRLQSPAILNSPSRILSSCMRVGNYVSDNSHEIRESDYGSYRDLRVEAQYIPYEENPQVLKTAIWLQLDELYKNDIQIYEQIKANVAVKVEQEDKSNDFSQEEVKNYHEAPISWASLNINPQLLEEKVRKFSAVFKDNKDILDGIAYYSASVSRKIFVDTEGREISENAVSLQLVLSAEALADDGMYLPLQKTWMAFSLDELPSDEEVLKAAREISETLSALKKAPVVESFTGPAILSPEASGVFFHEIFGHRVEGTRLKQENDAQTFKKKIGEQVLPKHLSVTFDPTIKYYQNSPLVGNYAFDDEGIPAQKVEVVKKGTLRNFLMSRTPIEGFALSNGHGRGQIGIDPVARQSNMIVESTQRLSDEELIKKLRKEAKSQKKEYAYYFKEVSGGYTTTSRYSPNAFNVTPLIVYKIYVDGRPNELVRGVDLVGTPLAMFSQIEACGENYKIFNGVCGAESGSVPVSCIAPALLVKQIETQKRAKSQSQPPLLPMPEADKITSDLSGEEIISQAIKKEVDRSLKGLKIEGLQSPFFISYTISDAKRLQVSASHGSLTTSDLYAYRGSGSRLLIGDYACSDENFESSTGGASGYDGSPSSDNDEAGIRYTVWKDLDAVYKNAAEAYEQKLSAIKQLNIPAKDLELPDWDKTPTVVMNDLPRKNIELDKDRYGEYVKAASSVFNEYPEILNSDVSIQISNVLLYFYNTEQTEFRYPLAYIALDAAVNAKTDEGEDLSSSVDFVFSNPDELPSIEEIKKQCRLLAEKLIEKLHAPKIEESYAGPVLFEDLAVVAAFYSNFFHGDVSLIANRKPLTSNGFSYGGNGLEEMMNKKITAKEITIEDLTGTREYKGVKLLGYAPIDGQGVVPPARLTLVENGILKTLLSDRVPTQKVRNSNGHALLGSGGSSSINPGVVRMSDTRTKSRSELKKELLKRAKEEGYEYAYIIREVAGGRAYPTELYQVSVTDGSEKRIRSASINNFDTQAFKNIVAVSNKELIYNTSAGNLVTIIVPDAILFEELQIQSDRVDNFRKPPLVAPTGSLSN